MAFKFIVAFTSLLAIAQAGLIAGPATVTTYAAPEHHQHVAYANPAVDAVAATHQNVVRSFGGTVSHHSKAIDTPYSSVRKEDTRISNNVYTPAVAKTLTYAAAPAATAAVYNHPAPTAAVYTHAAPTAAVYTHAAPTAAVYTHAAPTAGVYSHAAPTAYTQHEVVAPQTVYQPAHHQQVYTHAAAPVVKTIATPVYQHAVPAPAPVYHHQQPLGTTTYNHGPAASTYSHNAPGVAAYGTSQTVHYSPAETVSHMSFDGFGTHWGF